MAQAITRLEIAAALEAQPTDQLWRAFHDHVRVLETFWLSSTTVFAHLTQLSEPRRDLYALTIPCAFQSMDDWRFRRVKYVKARRSEIDSAISFVRNTALDRRCNQLAIAPLCRNACGSLRALLTTACHGYSDAQIPELIAGALYDIAAVRTRFPLHISDLVSYHPGHQVAPPLDPFVVMLQSAAKDLGIGAALTAMLDAVSNSWNHFTTPAPLDLPQSFYSETVDSTYVTQHYTAVRDFHRT